ncbi:hypothetical protein ACFXDE_02735 [Kitasatospora sp. NPDC059408]|uniref:hypothetical protein n=1 Tax=Kitasatospora sp. NPDC059408 TaxID=3346823 RepID=UPI0036862F25
MSTALDPAPAPAAERQKKPRAWRRHRSVLAIAGMALALLGTTVDTASATVPQSVYCPQNCWQIRTPPNGINWGQWQDANSAAAFWGNYNIDWGHTTFGYYDVSPQWGHGWPAQVYGGTWYAYFEADVSADRFIYYGGTFNDYAGQITGFERARGVGSSQAWSTPGYGGTGNRSPYVEYDMDSWTNTRPAGGRGDRRIVRNPNTGHTYVTFDHYNTFYYLGNF